jgi:hypothetical protein
MAFINGNSYEIQLTRAFLFTAVSLECTYLGNVFRRRGRIHICIWFIIIIISEYRRDHIIIIIIIYIRVYSIRAVELILNINVL